MRYAKTKTETKTRIDTDKYRLGEIWRLNITSKINLLSERAMWYCCSKRLDVSFTSSLK